MSFINLEDANRLYQQSTPTLTRAVKKEIKKRFQGFNDCFTEISKAQKSWSIPDPALRSQLRNDNAEYVVGTYKEFVRIFSTVPFTTKINHYMPYAVSVLENMIHTFFDEDL